MEKNISKIFLKINDKGLYHYRTVIIFAFIISLVHLHEILIPYLNISPMVEITKDNGDKIQAEFSYSLCHEYKDSQITVIDHTSSLITDFNLFCGKNDKFVYMTMFFSFFIGALIGAVYFFILIDKNGRRKTLMFILTLNALSFFITYFVWNPYLLCFVFIINGFCYGFIPNILVVYIIEITATGIRATYIGIIMIFAAICEVFIHIIYNTMSEWRIFFIVFSVLILALCLLVYLYIKESPRYLFYLGNFDQFKSTIIEISMINKVEYYSDFNLNSFINNSFNLKSYLASDFNTSNNKDIYNNMIDDDKKIHLLDKENSEKAKENNNYELKIEENIYSKSDDSNKDGKKESKNKSIKSNFSDINDLNAVNSWNRTNKALNEANINNENSRAITLTSNKAIISDNENEKYYSNLHKSNLTKPTDCNNNNKYKDNYFNKDTQNNTLQQKGSILESKKNLNLFFKNKDISEQTRKKLRLALLEDDFSNLIDDIQDLQRDANNICKNGIQESSIRRMLLNKSYLDYSSFDLLRYKSQKRNFIILAYMFCVTGFINNINNGANLHNHNNSNKKWFICFGEILVAIFTILISNTDLFGRKRTLIVFFHICSINHIISFFLDFSVINLIISKIMFFNIKVLLVYYSNEIFPTVLRTKGYGLCISFYRLFSLIGGLELFFSSNRQSNSIFLISTFLCSLVGFFLTETVNSPIRNHLPETLGEKVDDEGFK